MESPFSDGYQQALAAIQAERYAEAYYTLLELAKLKPDDPGIWFLLSWTAPNRAAAIRAFSHLCELDPNNMLTREGLVWSQMEWSAVGHKSRTARHESPKALHRSAPAGKPLLAARSLPADPRRAAARTAFHLGDLSFHWYLGFYLAAIGAAEWVTTYIHPQLGLIIHGSLLVLIFLHASLGTSRAQGKFLFTLALAPLIRLLSLSMPLVQFPFSYWYAIIGLPLLISAYLVLRQNEYTLAEIGINARQLPLQSLVGLTGLGLGWAEYQILKPEALVQSWHWQEIWMPVLILTVFTGFLEEFIFRGLMQRASRGVMEKWGLLYISLLFAVLHIGYRSFTDFVFVLGVGFIFGLAVRKTGSLWGVTLAHALTNISLFIIFPLL